MLGETKQFLRVETFSAGLVATIFGVTGPALIIISGATAAGLTYEQIISWIFSVYFFGGLLGLILSVKYRQPISGAFSIAGAVLVVEALTSYSLNEAIGAYLIANLIVFLLGVSGLIDRVMKWMPVPIVMGMIVGILIHFAVEMIIALEDAPILSGSAIFVFLVCMRFVKKVPPVLPALLTVLLLSYIMGSFQFEAAESYFILPQLIFPTFSSASIVSLSIPLALIIICTENAQATGVLRAEGYQPPVRSFAIYGSIIGFFASLFGAHAINVAGPMTAICAAKEAGEKNERYKAAVANGVLFMLFGLFASLIVPFIIAIPSLAITVIAGLAMIGVLLSSLKNAFSSNQFQMGAFFAFIIGMSGIQFLGISAPLWAIIGSITISLLVEREHFIEMHR